MKIFEKLRIIEAGETKNVIEENGKDYKLVISAESFPSLVALGNERYRFVGRVYRLLQELRER